MPRIAIAHELRMWTNAGQQLGADTLARAADKHKRSLLQGRKPLPTACILQQKQAKAPTSKSSHSPYHPVHVVHPPT